MSVALSSSMAQTFRFPLFILIYIYLEVQLFLKENQSYSSGHKIFIQQLFQFLFHRLISFFHFQSNIKKMYCISQFKLTVNIFLVFVTYRSFNTCRVCLRSFLKISCSKCFSGEAPLSQKQNFGSKIQNVNFGSSNQLG